MNNADTCRITIFAVFVAYSSIAEGSTLTCNGTSDYDDDAWVGRVYTYSLVPSPGYYASNNVGCCVLSNSSYTLYYDSASSVTTISSDLSNGDDTFSSNISTYIQCGDAAGSPRLYQLPDSSPWNAIEIDVDGGSGSDMISGSWADDLLDGGPGYDYIWGGPGEDILIGGLDEDALYGQLDADTLYGGYVGCWSTDDSEDWLFGGPLDDSNDTLYGCEGNCDYLDGGYEGDEDTCYCGEGDYDYRTSCSSYSDCETADSSCAYYPYI